MQQGSVENPTIRPSDFWSKCSSETTRSKHKPKFPCKLCEGDHLTYKCPSIVEVWRVWFHGHPIFEHPEVFQQPTSLSQVGPSHLASFPSVQKSVNNISNVTLLHFDQKSDGRIVGFSTLPCRMYDTMIFFKRQWIFVGYPTSLQAVG